MVNSKKKIIFQPEKKIKVEASFEKGDISSDAGLLILRECENKFKIIEQFSECFKDYRNKKACSYTVLQLISQRIYGICCGYEDLNDHDLLKKDKLFSLLTNNLEQEEIAGKSTLNRLELSSGNYKLAKENRYKRIVAITKKIERLFVRLFLQLTEKPPKSVVLDFDPTDITLHGDQEGKFYNGYYKDNCYLPMYGFINGFPLLTKLRKSDIDGSLGTIEYLEMIVSEIRKKWSDVKITFRGDSGFARDNIMTWCEENDVDYIIALPKTDRLLKKIETKYEKLQVKAIEEEEDVIGYTSFKYKTLKSWTKERRVIAKIKGIYIKENLFDYLPNGRFIVTSLKNNPKNLYEKTYCKRGDAVENRIKEQLNDMFAKRASSGKMRGNQLRIWFSAIAYILLHSLRLKGLKNTSMAKAQCNTIRLRLIKIGGLIRISCRRFFIRMSEACVFRNIYMQALSNIQKCEPLLC